VEERLREFGEGRRRVATRRTLLGRILQAQGHRVFVGGNDIGAMGGPTSNGGTSGVVIVSYKIAPPAVAVDNGYTRITYTNTPALTPEEPPTPEEGIDQ